MIIWLTHSRLNNNYFLLFCHYSELPVPPYDILISLSLEIILVLLAGKSTQFCKEFSNMGGLLHLLIQINKLNDAEFNKVNCFDPLLVV